MYRVLALYNPGLVLTQSISLLDPHGTGVIAPFGYLPFTSSLIDQLLGVSHEAGLSPGDGPAETLWYSTPISHPDMLRNMGIIEKTREFQ